MNQRKVKSLLHRLEKHAASNCANHSSGGCPLTPHGQCVFSFEADRPTANVCPYFMRSVGPSDPALFAEYIEYFPDNYPLKPKKPAAGAPLCDECRQPFEQNSNAQKYCADCSRKVRARKKAAVQREARLNRSISEAK